MYRRRSFGTGETDFGEPRPLDADIQQRLSAPIAPAIHGPTDPYGTAGVPAGEHRAAQRKFDIKRDTSGDWAKRESQRRKVERAINELELRRLGMVFLPA